MRVGDELPGRGHLEYASRMLADNAVTIHEISHPKCAGFNAWGCGDHFHVGHPVRADGDACKRAHKADQVRIANRA